MSNNLTYLWTLFIDVVGLVEVLNGLALILFPQPAIAVSSVERHDSDFSKDPISNLLEEFKTFALNYLYVALVSFFLLLGHFERTFIRLKSKQKFCVLSRFVRNLRSP